MKIYIIEGGIGRQIMFTALIPKLAERDGSQVITMSPYTNIFENNPHVYRSLARGTPFAWDDYIMNDKHEVVYCDPYFYDAFIKRKCHVIEGWCHQLGIEYDETVKPQIYPARQFTEAAEKFAKDNPNFILVQFGSGQSPIGYQPNKPYQNGGFQRNYPVEQAMVLVSKIRKQWPDTKIVIFGLPNEGYHFEGITSLNGDYMLYAALLKHAKTFIGINSSLTHMAAALDKEGIVLWGGTGPDQWGYKLHNNISGDCKYNTLYCSKPYLRDLGDYTATSRWQCQEPTCMKIDPDKIIAELEYFLS